MSRSFVLRMRNTADKSCRGNQSTHFGEGGPRTFFSECRVAYDMIWQNIVEQGRLQMTIWRMRISCWITKATHTLSKYVTFTAFPLQQWMQEHASLLGYTYVASVVILFSKDIGSLYIIVVALYTTSLLAFNEDSVPSL